MPTFKAEGLKPIKLTPEQARVFSVIEAAGAGSVRLWRQELAAADRLFELGLIARNTFRAEYVKMAPAGWEYLKNRSGA